MNLFRNRNLTLLALTMVVGAPLMAQDSTGQIVGTVKTKDGKPLAGAIVRLASPALQGIRTVATDANGGFRAPLLPPGSYTVIVTKEGFLVPRSEAEVGLGQIVRRDILAADASATSATVEVIASASTVDKSDVKASTLITSEFMDVIPRTTRGLSDAALLAPGVTTGIAGRTTIRGGQTTGNRFLLNGTDVADNIFNVSTGRAYYVDDSIAEIQVMQSPVHARYGNFSGGIVNAITKSGGNQITGVLRANFSRVDWSAKAPQGTRPSQGSTPGNYGKTQGEDLLNRTYTLQVGGPIWKDKIWFNVSTIKNPGSTAQITLSNPGATVTNSDGSPRLILPTEGQSFTQVGDTSFYEGKFTFALTPDHSIEFGRTFRKSTNSNQLTGNSFDPDTFYNRQDKNEYNSLGYRGVFGSNLTLEARWAHKKDTIQSGGLLNRTRNQRIDVYLSNSAYYRFNNATFSAVNPLERAAATWTANLTWYSPQTALGTHTLDVGFERVKTGQKSDNAQTPTGIRMFVSGINPDGTYRILRTGTPTGGDSIELSLTSAAEATSLADSFWFNDTLALNSNWQVMFGLRYDKASAEDTVGTKTIGSSKYSPRVQVTFDPWGDQSWLFRSHFAVYVGRMHDGFTTRFTYSGNPVREGYLPRVNGLAYTYAQAVDLNTWDISPAGFLYAAGGPTAIVDPAVKAPSATEYSASARRNWTDGSFLEFRMSRRVWKDFYNDFFVAGDEYNYNSLIVPGISVRNIAARWRTDGRVKRDYNNAEVEFLNILSSRWQFGGNYTYATLKGNGEGGDSSGANVSVTGDALGDFDAVHQANGRDVNAYAPYGNLIGDQRHKASLYWNYINKTSQGGIFTSSLLFNYVGATTYSLTRSQYYGSEVAAAATAAGSAIAAQYNAAYANYTRYYGPRGIGRFNDTFNFDLKLGLDLPLAGKLRFFSELTVFNVFNHWQKSTFALTTTATVGSPLSNSPLSGYRTAPWVTSGSASTFGDTSGWGTSGFADYVGGRSVRLSTGFKW